jgi:hypothetical protein
MSRRGLGAQAALLATLALAVPLAACGGGDDGEGQGGGGISQADVEDAGVKFAECMRERGIDVQDPKAGAQGLRDMLADADRDDPAFREAERECGKHLEKLVSEIDDDQRREFDDARLEFAECMRQKGFDVPDPPSGDGAEQGGDPLGGLDLDAPAVQAAMDTCSKRISSLIPGE